MKKLTAISAMVCLGFATNNCSDEQSLNQVFVQKQAKNSYLAQQQMAQMAYDRGDYDQALVYGENAYELAHDNPEVRHNLALIYLAHGGFGFFNSIDSMMNKKISSDASSDPFSTLATFLSVTNPDINALATYDGLDTDPAYEAYFKNIPLYIPKYPGDHATEGTPRHDVLALQRLNKAIALLCPLVPRSLVSDEVRATHLRYQCEPYTGPIEAPTQHLLVYILAHLIEAVQFNTVLLYSDREEDKGKLITNNNLVRRSAALKVTVGTDSLSTAAISAYARAAVALLDAFEQTFDFKDNSMLAELLLDLNIITDGMTNLTMLPKSFTSQIRSFRDSILEKAKNIPKTDSTANIEEKDLLALGQKLAEKAITAIGNNIDNYLSQLDSKLQGGVSAQADQLAPLCGKVTDVAQETTDLLTSRHCSEVGGG